MPRPAPHLPPSALSRDIILAGTTLKRSAPARAPGSRAKSALPPPHLAAAFRRPPEESPLPAPRRKPPLRPIRHRRAPIAKGSSALAGGAAPNIDWSTPRKSEHPALHAGLATIRLPFRNSMFHEFTLYALHAQRELPRDALDLLLARPAPPPRRRQHWSEDFVPQRVRIQSYLHWEDPPHMPAPAQHTSNQDRDSRAGPLLLILRSPAA